MTELLLRFRAYAHIDDCEDDELLITFLKAAEALAKEAGVEPQEDDKKKELYEVLILMTAAHWYDNRGIMTANTGMVAIPSVIPMSATWIIQVLRM